MRLWHYQLLPFLPRLQLLSQKKECDLIWKDIKEGKQTNHILINYIWNYDFPTIALSHYYYLLKNEFIKRGYNFINNSTEEDLDYYDYISTQSISPYLEHNISYLRQCYYNLEEKYQRGQKDFTKDQFTKLSNFVMSKIRS